MVTATYVNIFGVTARLNPDRGWEHNFANWDLRGHSNVFKPLHYIDIETQLEDCIIRASEKGVAHKVHMLVVNPPAAVHMNIENVLLDSDFEGITNASTCYFDIPNVRFGDIDTPILVRVAQAAGDGIFCAVANARGARL